MEIVTNCWPCFRLCWTAGEVPVCSFQKMAGEVLYFVPVNSLLIPSPTVVKSVVLLHTVRELPHNSQLVWTRLTFDISSSSKLSPMSGRYLNNTYISLQFGRDMFENILSECFVYPCLAPSLAEAMSPVLSIFLQMFQQLWLDNFNVIIEMFHL